MAKEKDTDSTSDAHNRGQEDAAKGWGNSNAPSLLHSIIDSSVDKERRDYLKGYEHGVKQREK